MNYKTHAIFSLFTPFSVHIPIAQGPEHLINQEASPLKSHTVLLSTSPHWVHMLHSHPEIPPKKPEENSSNSSQARGMLESTVCKDTEAVSVLLWSSACYNTPTERTRLFSLAFPCVPAMYISRLSFGSAFFNLYKSMLWSTSCY